MLNLLALLFAILAGTTGSLANSGPGLTAQDVTGGPGKTVVTQDVHGGPGMVAQSSDVTGGPG